MELNVAKCNAMYFTEITLSQKFNVMSFLHECFFDIAHFAFYHFFNYAHRDLGKDTGEKYLYKYRGEADVQSIIERKYRNTALGEAAEYNRDLDLSRP